MGYTHYWSTDVTFTQAFLDDVRKILAEQTVCDICGPDGTGEPIVNEEVVSLNGSKENDEAYETFELRSGGVPLRVVGYPNFAFCKTARNPYDAVVGAILLRALHHYGSKLGMSSDGHFDSEQDWGAPKKLYRKVFKEEPQRWSH